MYQNILYIIAQIIIYSGIVQGFYSAIVLTHTRIKNPANHYLAILLIVLSASILHSVFVISYFHNYHQVSFHIKEPFILLVVPFIWLYIKKLNEPQFAFKTKHLAHFLPFLIIMSVSLVFLIHKNENPDEHYMNAINIAVYIGAFIQYLFYLVYMLRIIRSFNNKALNELSNTENISPLWLKVFLYIFLAIFVLLVVMMIIAIHKLNASFFNTVVSIVFSITIYLLGYKGLFQQTIFTKTENVELESATTEIKVDPQLLQKLLDFMEKNKPWHDSELSLSGLAQKVEMSRNLLSEIINSGTGGNFYDFINKYRVEEVKELMNNPKYKDYTILALAFEAGFPSKSTFNSVFKKFTGLTPSEYKNSL